MEDNIKVKERYYNNGKLRYKHQYLMGKPHGEQLYYYDNGNLEYKDQYLKGKRHGEQLIYNSNGELWFDYYYIGGKEVSKEEWIGYIKPQHQTQFLTDLYV